MVTRLGLCGFARMLYGSFAGKVGGGGPDPAIPIVMYHRRHAIFAS
jgi:hypothetical protein